MKLSSDRICWLNVNLLGSSLLALLVGAGCSSSSEPTGSAGCLPEQTESCVCADGTTSFRTCGADGLLGDCQCGTGAGGTGGSASGGTTSEGGGAGESLPTGGVGQGGTLPATGGDPSTGGQPAGGQPNTGGQPGTGGEPTGGQPSTGGQAGSGGEPSTGGQSSTGGEPSTGGQSGAAGEPGTGGQPAGDRGTEAGVCARWQADRADMSEGVWSGDIATCDPGDISADGRANALRLFNLYRWLANLPEVQTTPELDEMAQACALLQTANSGLSHDPPQSWACWTQLGADGSATSNLSGGPGVESVDAYMVDRGNESTFGHRRIILSNWLGPIGLGSTGPGGKSCMQNMSGTGDAGRAWTPWPPEGIIPVQAFRPNGWDDLDELGWSVQSEEIDLASASVSVTSDGVPMAVQTSALTGNYGARYGLRIVPSGWSTQAGNTYDVSITGIATPISYSVQVVDCS